MHGEIFYLVTVTPLTALLVKAHAYAPKRYTFE